MGICDRGELIPNVAVYTGKAGFKDRMFYESCIASLHSWIDIEYHCDAFEVFNGQFGPNMNNWQHPDFEAKYKQENSYSP